MRKKTKKTDGFIAIVALGIFAILTAFGIIVQTAMVHTVESVKSTNQYYEASDVADSVMERLQFEINQREAGYSMETPKCVYGDFAVTSNTGGRQVTDQGDNDPICDEIVKLLDMADENIEITMEIKGRSEEDEKFTGSSYGDCPGIYGLECYVVPFPGTGDAGDRCDLYEPLFDAPDSAIIEVDHQGQLEYGDNVEGVIEQIDYSCNWNKLSFGSSSTDRAAIPFYFDTGEDGESPIGKDSENPIVNPFNTDEMGLSAATSFVLRVRTPCLPCVYDVAQEETNTNRLCEHGDDPTICGDDERYKLDDGSMNLSAENDIVVQWQLTGTCDSDGDGEDEECGLIQNIDPDPYESSAITESRINGEFPKHKVLFTISEGIDTTTYATDPVTHLPLTVSISEKLGIYKKPILSLLLIEKLISTQGKNVPYLEYQVLTDKPIANPKIKAEVTVNVDGNIFKKILYKEQEKSLIDFAIQN